MGIRNPAGRMAADSGLLVSLVEEFVSGLQDSKADDTATAVKAKQFTILQLVDALGSFSSAMEIFQSVKTKSSLLPAGCAVSMLRSLFQDVHVQSLMLSERGCVYTMLLNLMESREAGKFAEELFEVTSCYFPIDFSPETLILSLRAVLSGTTRFAEFLLPLIIEKLDADVQSAKIDSLQTLTACMPLYEHKHLAEFLPGLWTSIRREVFQTGSERVESAGLAALTALTSYCQHHLCEPDMKLVWPSAKLLQAASSASYRASHIVAAAVIPTLVEQYNSRTQSAHRRTILEVRVSS
ncbi:hypothetical protein CRUP_030630 [Coryphaenoides rupestris]|nr:hypothetical protein CRUP_030630 [Coryphaenoides rupestris]